MSHSMMMICFLFLSHSLAQVSFKYHYYYVHIVVIRQPPCLPFSQAQKKNRKFYQLKFLSFFTLFSSFSVKKKSTAATSEPKLKTFNFLKFSHLQIHINVTYIWLFFFFVFWESVRRWYYKVERIYFASSNKKKKLKTYNLFFISTREWVRENFGFHVGWIWWNRGEEKKKHENIFFFRFDR